MFVRDAPHDVMRPFAPSLPEQQGAFLPALAVSQLLTKVLFMCASARLFKRLNETVHFFGDLLHLFLELEVAHLVPKRRRELL